MVEMYVTDSQRASGDWHDQIEELREIPPREAQAAASIVDAYDQASATVKVVPPRTTRLEVTCTDDTKKPVVVEGLSPILAVQMLTTLASDFNVRRIELVIDAVKDALT